MDSPIFKRGIMEDDSPGETPDAKRTVTGVGLADVDLGVEAECATLELPDTGSPTGSASPPLPRRLPWAASPSKEDTKSAPPFRAVAPSAPPLPKDDTSKTVERLSAARGSPPDAEMPSRAPPSSLLPTRGVAPAVSSSAASSSAAPDAVVAAPAISATTGSESPPEAGIALKRGPPTNIEGPDPTRPRVEPATASVNVIWEFSVRDGFQPFDADCQGDIETQYQADPDHSTTARVTTGGRAILIAFDTMTQRLEASGHAGRQRHVRRRLLLAAPVSPPAEAEAGPHVWEFTVRDGYKKFEHEFQAVIERQYHAFKGSGMHPVGKLVLDDGNTVLIDFAAMTQRMENGSGRQRGVRRRPK